MGILKEEKDEKSEYVHKRRIVWFNVIAFLILHLGAMHGFYLILTKSLMLLTFIWTLFIVQFSGICVTMGAHRFFTHRSFKCNSWVKAILVFGHTVAGQDCLYIWVRNHRQHHKYSDTNADPHNAKRGFFFSHIGWLMVRKHPDVIKTGKNIDMTDIEMDPLTRFQRKYYNILFIMFVMLMPTLVPHIFWGETLWNGFFVCFMLRLTMELHFTFLVNSAAHSYGNKPFNDDIMPVENKYVSFIGMGEGWHNYHHTFPWDYRASEFGQYFNLTTIVIDFAVKMGWVWDTKYATPAMVQRQATNRGDGTHVKYGRQKTVAEDREIPDDDTYDELFWQEERSRIGRKVAQKG